MNTDIGELVNALTVGMAYRSIYFSEHPKVFQFSESFVIALRGLLTERNAEQWPLGIDRGRLIHDGRVNLRLSLIARRLIDWAEHLKCSGFTFHGSLTAGEVRRFWDAYVEACEPVQSMAESAQLLRSYGIEHIELLQAAGMGSNESGSEVLIESQRLQARVKVYQSLLATVERAHLEGSRGRTVDSNGVRTQAEMLARDNRDSLHCLMELSHYPDYDGYTIGHSVRASLLAVAVGSHLGLPPSMLIELSTAGLLHDVGKSRMPHEILYKNGPLDQDERRVMSQHPRIGGEMLIESPDSGPMCVGAAFGHHVRFDRLGYPAVRSWGKLGFSTAIVQVCDVFEALTAVRPYKPSFTSRQAYEILLGDKHAFHPQALRAFCGAIGLYPPGTRVVLSDGTEAVVVRAGATMARPVVQRVQTDSNPAAAEEAPQPLDLSAREAESIGILRVLPPQSSKVESSLGCASAKQPSLV